MTRALVYGKGTNDAGYNIKVDTWREGIKTTEWRCPYYNRWVNMLKRCYSSHSLLKHPTYKDCTVCEEWLTFSNFKRWMEKQDWEGMQLDKDILGSGKFYCPDICVFVPRYINCFIYKTEDNVIGKTGAVPKGDKYMCTVRFKNKVYFNKVYKTPKEANMMWKNKKVELLNSLKLELDDIDNRLYSKLISIYL